MNTTLLGRAILTLVIIVPVISICIECTPTDENTTEFRRYRTVTETLNYLYRSLADQMNLEEKCKMYAVILSMTEAGGLLYVTTFKQLLAMPRDIVDRYHERMDPKKLSVLYMGAIDKYRTSQLAPPFLDLIGCLKQINQPIVERYLDNKHLKAILYLYQRALKSPDKRIDMLDFDLSKFHVAFQVHLRSILRDHLKGYDLIYGTGQKLFQPSNKVTSTNAKLLIAEDDQSMDPDESGARPSSSKNPPQQPKPTLSVIERHRRQRIVQERLLQMMQADQMKPAQDSTESATESAPASDQVLLGKRPRGRPPVVDEQELKEREKRRRRLARERDRRRRLQNPLKYREERRLRQQRQRLMNLPDSRKCDEERTEHSDQSRRLERQMQLQSQSKQVHRTKLQQTDQPQLYRFLSVLPTPEPTAQPVISAPGPLSQQLQRQQLRTQTEHGSTFDELTRRPVPDRPMLDTLSHSFRRLPEGKWPFHSLICSQHTFEPSLPALIAQLQPERRQSVTTQAIVKPTVMIPPRTLAPVVSTQISPFAPRGNEDSIKNQTSTVRDREELENLFAPVPPRTE